MRKENEIIDLVEPEAEPSTSASTEVQGGDRETSMCTRACVAYPNRLSFFHVLHAMYVMCLPPAPDIPILRHVIFHPIETVPHLTVALLTLASTGLLGHADGVRRLV